MAEEGWASRNAVTPSQTNPFLVGLGESLDARQQRLAFVFSDSNQVGSYPAQTDLRL